MAINSGGHTWILLRGLGREKGHWGHFTEQLAVALPGDEILAIDLPGTGEFRNGISPRTIAGIFNFVRAEAIAKARKQSQFKVLGISLGAMVAMEWLRQKSEDLAACVLLNSSSRALSPLYYRLRWQVWRDFLKLLVMQNPREYEQGIVDLVINSPQAREAALPLWIKIANERPITYLNSINQFIAAGVFTGLTKTPSTPTLLLSGLGDRLVDPSCSGRLHEKHGWPLHRHPWGGHDLSWDDPQWVIERIQEWNSAINA